MSSGSEPLLIFIPSTPATSFTKTHRTTHRSRHTMAEAFPLISLAANIAQFVEYSMVLTSKVKEIYRSAEGAGKENLEIEMVVQDINNLGANIAAPLIRPVHARNFLKMRK